MRITGGAVFDPEQGFIRRDLYTSGTLIAASSSDGRTLDAAGCWVVPGFTDLHFHGCRGMDFSDGDPAGLQAMADYELSRGVTQICPAGMTLPEEQLLRICQTAASHQAAAATGAELVGIHLEGPFLSAAKKGAQNGAYLQSPSIALLRRLQEAAEGLVKLVTIAPEYAGAADFIQEASALCTVSLGHTTAGYDVAYAALEAGARHITHLYNAMPPMSHRAPGLIGAAFDHPACRVELICDGVHVHPSVVRATFRMFGAQRVILISDSMRAAGMPDGIYTLGGQDVTVQGTKATLADGTLAGSVTDLMGCVRQAVAFGIPLADAIRAAALNPAQALGIDGRYGTLDAGKTANLVVLDEALEIKAILFHGEPVELASA